MMSNTLEPSKEYNRVLSNPDNFIASDSLLEVLGSEWLNEESPNELVSWRCSLRFSNFSLGGELVSVSIKKKTKSLAIRCEAKDIMNLLNDTCLKSFCVESIPEGTVIVEEHGLPVMIDIQLEGSYHALVLVTLKQLQDN